MFPMAGALCLLLAGLVVAGLRGYTFMLMPLALAMVAAVYELTYHGRHPG
jgi:hypothetical protein